MKNDRPLIDWLESQLKGRPIVHLIAMREKIINPSNRLIVSDCRKYLITIERVTGRGIEVEYDLHQVSMHDSSGSSNCFDSKLNSQPLSDRFSIHISSDGEIESCDYVFLGSQISRSRLFSRNENVGSAIAVEEFVEQIAEDRVQVRYENPVFRCLEPDSRVSAMR